MVFAVLVKSLCTGLLGRDGTCVLSSMAPCRVAVRFFGLHVTRVTRVLRKGLLSHFRHQVLAAEEAEDGDGVIFVEYSESPEDFVQSGAAGGYVVYDEDVLIPDGGAEGPVFLCGEFQELEHIWAEFALLHVFCNGEVVFAVDEIHHLANGSKSFVFLCLGVSGTAVFKDVIEILPCVGVRVECDV